MSPTNPTSEEVVEKKASAPVSTACLIIACLALLGGIVFQVMEIAEYRSGTGDPKDQASKRYKADLKKLKDAVEETLSKATVGAVPEEATPPTPTDAVPAPTDTAPAPKDATPAPKDATPAPKDAAPAEPAPGDATPGDAPAGDAGGADAAAPAEGDKEK
jgi:hypothetical protein